MKEKTVLDNQIGKTLAKEEEKDNTIILTFVGVRTDYGNTAIITDKIEIFGNSFCIGKISSENNFI